MTFTIHTISQQNLLIPLLLFEFPIHVPLNNWVTAPHVYVIASCHRFIMLIVTITVINSQSVDILESLLNESPLWKGEVLQSAFHKLHCVHKLCSLHGRLIIKIIIVGLWIETGELHRTLYKAFNLVIPILLKMQVHVHVWLQYMYSFH